MTQQDVLDADSKFYTQNYNAGIKRRTAAVLVKYFNPIMSGKNPKLRGSKAPQAKTQAKGIKVQTITSRGDVPATYGFTVRSREPKVTRSSTGAHITGSDFAGSVYGCTTSAYEPAATVPMNPSYFQSAMLGNLSRVYEKYRFKKATLEYVPSVPTSTQGQLVILSDRTIKNPFLDGSSASFLGRALSQANAVACPLWQRTTFEVACSAEWFLVDPLIDGDLDDSISQELQLYSFGTAAMTTGILILHYEIEFKDPLYTYHPTVTPIPVGVGTLASMIDDSNVNATSDLVRLTGSSVPLTLGAGSIYRLVFQRSSSTPPVGTGAWSTAVSVQTTTSIVTSGGTTNQLENINMNPGTTLYGVLNNSALSLYTTYEYAMVGTANGALTYRSATTGAGIWYFFIAGVRLGSTFFITNQ